MKPEILHEDKMDESEKTSQNGFFHIRPLNGENVIWKLRYIFFAIFPSFTKDI